MQCLKKEKKIKESIRNQTANQVKENRMKFKGNFGGSYRKFRGNSEEILSELPENTRK